MEIKVLKVEKNEMEFEIESLTLAEILRVYLNKDSNVTFAAWKREHHTMNPVVKVKTSSKAPKAIVDVAVKKIISDLEGIEKEFKKLKA
jgi:DNA-directed RNA polymerase subunit L